jgi:diguanylate cyclase (GGDEF)-like protein
MKIEAKVLILIVDDAKEIRSSIKIALKDENYIFEEAKDGNEAIEKCKKFKPGIILMDALMPEKDGFEATKDIRNISDFKEIPILMITSLSTQIDKIRALKCGVSDFIPKPSDKQELIARCNSYASIAIHIKNREKAESELKKQHHYLQSIVDSIDDSIMVISSDYEIKLMNKTIKQRLKPDIIADIKHPKCYEVSHNRSIPCDGDEHRCPLQEVLATKKNITIIHNHSQSEEKDKFIELAATPFCEDGNCLGIIEVGRDVTTHIQSKNKLKMQKENLKHISRHDHLTGLANRFFFYDSLEQSIKKAKRNKTRLALFFIDLDKFKDINDNLGHDAGDFVLKSVAKQVKGCIRGVDILSRIGGDEFTLILEEIDSVKSINKIATELLKNIRVPIDFKGKIINTTASIGISIYPDDSLDFNKLVKYADIAMYNAKKNAKNNIKLYNSKLNDFNQKGCE